RARGAFVHLTELVRPAAVIQDPLGRGRLPGIDVRHDADVPRLLQRVRPLHLSSLLSRLCRVCPIHAERGVSLRPPSRFGPSVTSDSERTPCWPPPSYACPRASSRRCRGCSRRRAARRKASRPSSARHGAARRRRPTASTATAVDPAAPRPAPRRSPRPPVSPY